MGDHTDPDPSAEPSNASPPPSDDATTTSGTVIVEGDPITVDHQTTVRDLKKMANSTDPEEKATYLEGDELQVLNDDDHVLDRVRDGDTISFQPVEGTLFG